MCEANCGEPVVEGLIWERFCVWERRCFAPTNQAEDMFSSLFTSLPTVISAVADTRRTAQSLYYCWSSCSLSCMCHASMIGLHCNRHSVHYQTPSCCVALHGGKPAVPRLWTAMHQMYTEPCGLAGSVTW